MRRNVRYFWLVTGLVAVAVSAVGLVLPLLPTTPFLLVAAFAFARSSERMDAWLREHRTFGPLIGNWHREGSIDRKAKLSAMIVILATPIVSWLLGVPPWIVGCQLVVLGVVTLFILTRPSPGRHRPPPRG